MTTEKDDLRRLHARVRDVRRNAFGPRGARACARVLGVSPSTWKDYETRRVAPVPVLARLCRVTGVDLRWLLTGQFATTTPSDAATLSARSAEVLERFDGLVRRRSDGLAATVALLDLLEEADALEAESTSHEPPTVRVDSPGAGLVPVLGRTAAAVPHFWHAAEDVQWTGLPVPSASSVRRRPALLQALEHVEPAPRSVDARVRLLQLSEPTVIHGLSVAEFIDGRDARIDLRDAFALRIDGDSMIPLLEDGDCIVLSPRHPARPGHLAVVQLQDQIGATCKVYRAGAARISLIPLNERYRPTTHRAEDVVWALDVLYRVRTQATLGVRKPAGRRPDLRA
jgi:SOS-response transcriptional repressor LexA